MLSFQNTYQRAKLRFQGAAEQTFGFLRRVSKTSYDMLEIYGKKTAVFLRADYAKFLVRFWRFSLEVKTAAEDVRDICTFVILPAIDQNFVHASAVAKRMIQNAAAFLRKDFQIFLTRYGRFSLRVQARAGDVRDIVTFVILPAVLENANLASAAAKRIMQSAAAFLQNDFQNFLVRFNHFSAQVQVGAGHTREALSTFSFAPLKTNLKNFGALCVEWRKKELALSHSIEVALLAAWKAFVRESGPVAKSAFSGFVRILRHAEILVLKAVLVCVTATLSLMAFCGFLFEMLYEKYSVGKTFVREALEKMKSGKLVPLGDYQTISQKIDVRALESFFTKNFSAVQPMLRKTKVHATRVMNQVVDILQLLFLCSLLAAVMFGFYAAEKLGQLKEFFLKKTASTVKSSAIAFDSFVDWSTSTLLPNIASAREAIHAWGKEASAFLDLAREKVLVTLRSADASAVAVTACLLVLMSVSAVGLRSTASLSSGANQSKLPPGNFVALVSSSSQKSANASSVSTKKYYPIQIQTGTKQTAVTNAKAVDRATIRTVQDLLGIGKEGQVLTWQNGKPVWQAVDIPHGTGRPQSGGGAVGQSANTTASVTGSSGRGGGGSAPADTSSISQSTSDARYVSLGGGTVTGPLTVLTTGVGLNVKAAISGSSLTISSLTSCDTIDTDASGNFVCGVDATGGGTSQSTLDARYVTAGGDTMTGALVIQNGNTHVATATALLNVRGTISGATLFAQNSIRSSGSLVIDTTAIVKGNLTTRGTLSGAALVGSNLVSCSALQTSSAGALSCGTTLSLSGLDSRYINTGGDTMTGVLAIQNGNTHVATATALLNVRGTISGATLFAQNSIRSSGSLVIDTTALVKGNLTTRGTLSGAALTIMNGTSYFMGNVGIGKTSPGVKFEVAGTMSGAALTVMNGASYLMGNVSVGTTGNAGSAKLNVAGTMSGRSLYVTGTGSAPLLFTQIVTGRVGIGTSAPRTKLEVVGTLSGSALTVMNGTSYFMGNVGIGKTSPGVKFEVTGTMSGAALTVMNGASYLMGNVSVGTTGNAAAVALNIAGTASGRSIYISGTGSVPMIMTKQTTGNVGIGTSAPKTKLEVVGTLSGSALTIMNGTSYFMGNVGIGKTSPGVKFEVAGTMSGAALTVMNGASYLMGNVGVGTTGNAGSAKLNVAGTMSGRSLYVTGTGSAPLLFTQIVTGRVGIGTSAPRTKLEVVGTISGSALTIMNGASYLMGNTSIGTTGNAGAVALNVAGTASGRSIYISGTGSAPMIMTKQTTGNVGIGTSAPRTKLEVVGTISGSALTIMNGASYLMGNTSIGTTGNAGAVALNVAGTASGRSIYISGTGSAPMIMTKQTTGNVGIGTSAPKTKLEVTGTFSGAALTVMNGTSYLMGNVGIGKTAPSATLDVVGTASGRIVRAQDTLASSGVVLLKKRAGSATGNILIVDTTGLVYDATNKRIGVGTAGPRTTLDVAGTISGTSLTIMGNTGFGSGSALTGKVNIFTTDAFNNPALYIRSQETTSTQDLFVITSDFTTTNNKIFRITASGSVFADGAYRTGGADYAEYFHSSDYQSLTNGDLVCIDTTRNNAVIKCRTASDPNLMGIVSTNPGYIGNASEGKSLGLNGLPVPGYVLVGLIGQVPAKVIVESGDAIEPGDSLTSAETPGYARKANPGETTVGVALEGLSSGQGVINVLISRTNKSLTVETLEDRVRSEIASMKIGDAIQSKLNNALSGSTIAENLMNQVQTTINPQINTLNGTVASLQNQILQLQQGSSSSTPSGPSIGSLEGTALQALNLTLDQELSVGGNAHIRGNLSVDGGLLGTHLFPQGLVIQNGLEVSGDVHASSLHIDQDSLFSGAITMNGPLVLTRDVFIDNGAVLHVADLLEAHSLSVLGNVNIQGLATFFGDVLLKGDLTVGSKQGGYAVVVQNGTGVLVHLSSPFSRKPIVTASTDAFVFSPWRIRVIDESSFVIELASPASQDITFSWIAIPVEDPTLTTGSALPEQPMWQSPAPPVPEIPSSSSSSSSSSEALLQPVSPPASSSDSSSSESTSDAPVVPDPVPPADDTSPPAPAPEPPPAPPSVEPQP